MSVHPDYLKQVNQLRFTWQNKICSDMTFIWLLISSTNRTVCLTCCQVTLPRKCQCGMMENKVHFTSKCLLWFSNTLIHFQDENFQWQRFMCVEYLFCYTFQHWVVFFSLIIWDSAQIFNWAIFDVFVLIFDMFNYKPLILKSEHVTNTISLS